jgi:hypothetical protein
MQRGGGVSPDLDWGDEVAALSYAASGTGAATTDSLTSTAVFEAEENGSAASSEAVVTVAGVDAVNASSETESE